MKRDDLDISFLGLIVRTNFTLVDCVVLVDASFSLFLSLVQLSTAMMIFEICALKCAQMGEKKRKSDRKDKWYIECALKHGEDSAHVRVARSCVQCISAEISAQLVVPDRASEREISGVSEAAFIF